MTTFAEPSILFAGRPAALRAADARAGWIVALFLLKLAVWNNDRIVDGLHQKLSRSSSIAYLRAGMNPPLASHLRDHSAEVRQIIETKPASQPSITLADVESPLAAYVR